MPDEIPITLRVSIDPATAEKVLVTFLREYAQDAGAHGYVVGLSGGLDSAVSAALAVRAVGPDRVNAFVLPEDATPKDVLDDAQAVADHLDVTARTLSIQPLLDAFAKTVPDATREQASNAKARFRMVLLHAEAAAAKALVLGTGNKSEIQMAYFTKYGDGGVDVQPLGDLYKTQVRQLAEHLGLPERIRTKPPSAGLWVGQTDEQELGLPYETLDRLLLGLELALPHDVIAKVLDLSVDTVAEYDRRRARGQHKRRMPMAPKLGIRTPGNDWRQPALER